jgi:hypothetical protein
MVVSGKRIRAYAKAALAGVTLRFFVEILTFVSEMSRFFKAR